MPNEEEKSYADSLASDIFHMVESARESGLDVDGGFQNDPFSTPDVAIKYLFYPKKDLMQLPMPAGVKKRIGAANVLAQVSKHEKIAGIHLIYSSPKPFSKLKSIKEAEAAMDQKGVQEYADHVAQVLREDLVAKVKPDTDTQQ